MPCTQDVSGGQPVQVSGEQSGLLYGMEMDTAAAATELRGLGKDDNADRINGFLSSVGMGAFAEQLKDLQLGASAFMCAGCMGRLQPLLLNVSVSEGGLANVAPLTSHAGSLLRLQLTSAGEPGMQVPCLLH